MSSVANQTNQRNHLILLSLIILALAGIGFLINFWVTEYYTLQKPLNLLLIGMDQNILTPESQDSPNKIARTDTLILTVINPNPAQIAMVSIPRDSLVDIPGHGLDKINQASVIGGYALTKK